MVYDDDDQVMTIARFFFETAELIKWSSSHYTKLFLSGLEKTNFWFYFQLHYGKLISYNKTIKICHWQCAQLIKESQINEITARNVSMGQECPHTCSAQKHNYVHSRAGNSFLLADWDENQNMEVLVQMPSYSYDNEI